LIWVIPVYCNWREDRGPEMWFDDFAILPD